MEMCQLRVEQGDTSSRFRCAKSVSLELLEGLVCGRGSLFVRRVLTGVWVYLGKRS